MQRVVRCPQHIFDEAVVTFNGIDPVHFLDNNVDDGVTGRSYLDHVRFPDEYKREIFSMFGLFNINDEPTYGNFAGYHSSDGAFTHKHKDHPPTANTAHVRCNILVENSREGGLPIIDDQIIQVSVGDVWICFASEEEHGSQPIKAGKRKILSLGALIDRSEAIPRFLLL